MGGLTGASQRWCEALQRLTDLLADRGRGVESGLHVGVIFQVPGDLLKPDRVGVRAGQYDSADNLLMVDVALPDEPPDDVDAAVRDSLHQALDIAERWATRRKIATELTELRTLAASI